MKEEVAKLLNTYKDKWVNEYGNCTTDELEEFWSDAFTTFESTLFNNAMRNGDTSRLPKDAIPKPSTNVISAPMGSGKSTALMHYLKNMNRYYRALIVVELIETADEYAEYLKDEGCVAVHSKNNNTIDSCLNSRIMVITHNMLVQMLKKTTADELFESYHLIVIDEQINTYEHIYFSYYEIDSKVLPALRALNLDDEYGSLFTSLQEEMSDFRVGKEKIRVLHRYHKENNNILDWSNIDKAIKEKLSDGTRLEDDLYKNLKDLSIKIQRISRQGRYKLSFLQREGGRITYNVVIDFFPSEVSKVILDGTASINDTYKLLNENLGFIHIKTYPNARNYSKAAFSFCTLPTGKSKIAFPKNSSPDNAQNEDIKAALQKLVSRVNERYKNETDAKVLFIVHKDNEAYLERLLGDNMAVTHWGRHIGLNDYRDYNKVVIYGLNHRPVRVYSAMHFSTFSSKSNLDYSSINEMESSVLSCDILQAMNRIALRKVEGHGHCPDGVEVFIALPSVKKTSTAILNKIKSVMPTAKYVEDDTSNPMYNLLTTVKSNVHLLTDFLRTSDEIVLPSSIYDKAHGCMSRDEYRTIFNNRNVQATKEELSSIGWVLTHPTKLDKERYRMGNRTTNVFKYVGVYNPFQDETSADY